MKIFLIFTFLTLNLVLYSAKANEQVYICLSDSFATDNQVIKKGLSTGYFNLIIEDDSVLIRNNNGDEYSDCEVSPASIQCHSQNGEAGDKTYESTTFIVSRIDGTFQRLYSYGLPSQGTKHMEYFGDCTLKQNLMIKIEG